MALTNSSLLGFGRYQNMPIGIVPASYMLWLNEQEWLHRQRPLIKQWITENLEDLKRRAIQERRMFLNHRKFLYK